MKKGLVVFVMCMILFGLAACGGEEKKVSKEITNIEEAFGKEIPEYRTMGLTRPLFYEGDGGYQMCIQNTNIDEFEAYASLLEENGFTLWDKKEISAGSDTQDKNLFYTYTGKGIHIYYSWNPGLKVARSVMTPEETLPAKEKPTLEASDTITPSVTQMLLEGDGMQYVVQLPDGKFIVIDGGVYNLADTWRLRDYFTEKTPEGQTPVIACWMYTHPDPDHIGLATQFLGKYAEEVKIESFAYNFASDKFETSGNQDDVHIINSFKALEKEIATYYPKAIRYNIHAGQTYYFKGLEVEILQTGEEFYPNTPSVWNDTSATWRMKFDNGQTALFLGDSMQVLCQLLEDTYGDYMKSDMLQLAHHGLIGGDLELYQYIDPDICFWSSPEDKFNGTYTGYTHKYCLGEGGCDYNGYLRDNTIKERTHYHNGMMSIVPIQ